MPKVIIKKVIKINVWGFMKEFKIITISSIEDIISIDKKPDLLMIMLFEFLVCF